MHPDWLPLLRLHRVDLEVRLTSLKSNQQLKHVSQAHPLHRLVQSYFGSAIDELCLVALVNIAVQQYPMAHHPNKGASFFLPPADLHRAKILKGLEIWPGLYSSLRPGVGRLFLNVDTTSQPMYQSGNLITVMEDLTRRLQRGQSGPAADISAAGLAKNGRLQVELDRSVFSFR